MENVFNRTFDPFETIGSEITAEIDGFIVSARIEHDSDHGAPDKENEGFWPSAIPSAPGYVLPENYDAEALKAADIMAAWNNNEWFYCGIVLSVSKVVNIKGRTQDRVIISDHAASLWGIECNYPGGNNVYLTETANELVQEALSFAKECVKQITA